MTTGPQKASGSPGASKASQALAKNVGLQPFKLCYSTIAGPVSDTSANISETLLFVVPSTSGLVTQYQVRIKTPLSQLFLILDICVAPCQSPVICSTEEFGWSVAIGIGYIGNEMYRRTAWLIIYDSHLSRHPITVCTIFISRGSQSSMTTMSDIYLASFYSPDRYSWTHIYLDNTFLEMFYTLSVLRCSPTSITGMPFYIPSTTTIHACFVHMRPRAYVGELSMDPSLRYTCANDSPRLIAEGTRQLARWLTRRPIAILVILEFVFLNLGLVWSTYCTLEFASS